MSKPLITLTDRALEELENKRSRGEGLLRIDVLSKGCAGKSYGMEWVDQARRGDEIVVLEGGLNLLIAPAAQLWLAGTVMDWREDQWSSGFVFENPNEVQRCGCGLSFAA